MLFDQLRQVLVAGENDADIDADGLVAADGFKFAFLKDAQQLDLEGGGCGVDFIKENRAAIGPRGTVPACRK